MAALSIPAFLVSDPGKPKGAGEVFLQRHDRKQQNIQRTQGTADAIGIAVHNGPGNRFGYDTGQVRAEHKRYGEQSGNDSIHL